MKNYKKPTKREIEKLYFKNNFYNIHKSELRRAQLKKQYFDAQKGDGIVTAYPKVVKFLTEVLK